MKKRLLFSILGFTAQICGSDEKLFVPFGQEPNIQIPNLVQLSAASSNQNLDDYELFKLIQSLLDTVSVHIPLTRREPNPYFNQTTQGLFLEYCNGYARCIHTPWGQIDLCEGILNVKKIEDMHNALTSRLNLIEEHPVFYCPISNQPIGPVYRVSAVEDVQITHALKGRSCVDFANCKVAKEAWKKLQDKYDKEQS